MQQLSGNQPCLSNLVLDEWFAGELDAEARVRAEDHLLGCSRCAARRDALAGERSGFLQAAPDLRALQARVVGRTPRPKRGWPAVVPALVSAGALAAIALIALQPANRPAGTRSKGGTQPQLGLFVKHGARIARAASGDTVHPGDRVRFTYTSDRDRHLALLNRDALGARIYYPSGPHAARVAAGSGVALDFSVELDAAPGVERMVAVFCDGPFLVEPLRVALAAGSRITPAKGCVVDTIDLRKAAPE